MEPSNLSKILLGSAYLLFFSLWFLVFSAQELLALEDHKGKGTLLEKVGTDQDSLLRRQLIRDAEAGDAYSQAILSRFYLLGMAGIKVDFDEGFYWAAESAKQGDWYGKFLDAKYEFNFASEEKALSQERANEKFAKMIEVVRKQAKQGNSIAEDALGWMYHYGMGVKADPKLAFYWYKKAAESNNIDGQYHLAVAYEEGIGTSIDLFKAIKYYEMAAKRGDRLAQNTLVWKYSDGKNINLEKARYWLHRFIKGNTLLDPKDWEFLVSPFQYAELLSKSMVQTMIQCPKRLWQGYTWQNTHVLMVSLSQKLAFHWKLDAKTNSKELLKTDFAALPHELRQNDFGLGEWKGKPSIGINYDSYKYLDALQEVLIHEGFHHLDQKGWEGVELNQRGIVYPAPWQPRYYRSEIIGALYDAILEKEADALKKAAYWYQRWLKEYPNEVERKRPMDIIEGSAEYVGRWGSLLSDLGCSATELQLKSVNQARAFKEQWVITQPQVDSYKIGWLAGSLLRQQEKSDWEKRIASGKTFLEVLLDPIETLSQKENAKLQQLVKDMLNEQYETVEPVVTVFQEQLKGSDFVNVYFPMEWISGIFNASEQVSWWDGKEYRSLNLDYNGHLAYSSEVTPMKISWNVVEITNHSPCQDDYHPQRLMVSIPYSQIKQIKTKMILEPFAEIQQWPIHYQKVALSKNKVGLCLSLLDENG